MARAYQAEKRARALCAELARVTDGRPMQWRMVAPIAKAVGVDDAAAYAAVSHAIQQDGYSEKGSRRNAPPSRMRGKYRRVALVDSQRSSPARRVRL
jgi:hypothetical protein